MKKNKCKICEYYRKKNKFCIYCFIRIEYSTSYNNCKYFKKNSNDAHDKKVPYKRKKKKYIKEIRRRLGNITMRKNETKFKKLKKLCLKLDEADEQIESLKNVISYTISEFNKGKNLKISYLENFFDDEE